MSDFISRFELRGDAVKKAYTSADSKAARPGSNALIDVIVDVKHRAVAAGLDFDSLMSSADVLFGYERALVGEGIDEHIRSKTATRIAA